MVSDDNGTPARRNVGAGAGATTAGGFGSIFAPRPLRMSRSAAAVGRAAGSGERQRCSAALTSALSAGPG